MDACPPEITDPTIRERWPNLGDGRRTTLLVAARQSPSDSGRGSSGAAAGYPPRAVPPSGLQAPQGNMYSDDDSMGEEEYAILRERMRVNRRRLSSGGTFVPAGHHASDAAPIDPQLVLHDHHMLLERSHQLEARISTLEAHGGTAQPQAVATVPHARGGRTAAYAARGGLAGNRRARQVDNGTPAGLEERSDGVYCPDPNAEKDDSGPLDILKINAAKLSVLQKNGLTKMQVAVRLAFRQTTGVLSTEVEWPEWSSDADEDLFPGMPVNFKGSVEHPVNRTLLTRVAAVAMQDLKKNVSSHAAWMNAPDVKLTSLLLLELAKVTFRGFKRNYRGQTDSEVQTRLDDGARATRRLNRRKKKCANLKLAAPGYQAEYGVDPLELLVPDMMSDDASGPEDENIESKIEWKCRMAQKAGMVGRTDDELSKMVFFEVIRPNWRSEALTKVLHELWAVFWRALNIRSARAMTPRIKSSDRTSDKPPQFSPYNFGINQAWYDAHKDKDTHAVFLRDWFSYPDPAGFGVAASPIDPPDGAAGGN
ncbi:hypothetical protein TRAPUB_9380 [Trametes pubescens]|uniref:Uncharacterized protein n=1 Tax=Trametes pubescens TaxID=154538 RepID=A0A1M2W2I5_TRAPU|nr:hypothetical protein TRAPUB_9380 [Trametes pubescens]